MPPSPRRSVSILILALGLVWPGLPTTAWALDAAERLTVTDGASTAVRLAPYGGRWRRVEDATMEAARLATIDSAIAGLSWLMRGIASPVLKKSTAPPAEMGFVWDGERLHQLVEADGGRFQRPVDLGGEPVERVDARGEAFTSHWTWSTDGLRVHWRQSQAYGDNLYRFDPEDQTLRVEHTIHVTAVSDVEPIVYHSRFDRVEPPSISAAGPDPVTVSGRIERPDQAAPAR